MSTKPPDSFTVATVLDLERNWWKSHADKDVAIRNRFAMDRSEYDKHLRKLISTDEALEYDAPLVRRIRRALLTDGKRLYS